MSLVVLKTLLATMQLTQASILAALIAFAAASQSVQKLSPDVGFSSKRAVAFELAPAAALERRAAFEDFPDEDYLEKRSTFEDFPDEDYLDKRSVFDIIPDEDYLEKRKIYDGASNQDELEKRSVEDLGEAEVELIPTDDAFQPEEIVTVDRAASPTATMNTVSLHVQSAVHE